MIGKTSIGKSFGGCVGYQYEKVEKGIGEVILSQGVRDYNREEMTADFNTQRKMNPNLGQAVWHTSISFRPEEANGLDSEKMKAIAQDWIRGMNLENTQYAVIRHTDTDHPHFHIIANRVGNDGRAISDSHNYARSQKLLRQLELKHELSVVEEQKQQQRLSLAHVPEPDQTRIGLRDEVRSLVASARSLEELRQAAQARQIKMEIGTNQMGQPVGVRFEQHGYRFKGSELDRALSMGQITQKLRLNHEQAQKYEQGIKHQISPQIEEKRGRGMSL
jgi:hypothetical protein